MRFNEFNEGISKAKSKKDLLKWISQISSYIDTFGDNHILYREFRAEGESRPFFKVNNKLQTPKNTNPGYNKFQAQTLEELKIANPVFCRMVKDGGVEHANIGGDRYILIPPKSPDLTWSPVIHDLGQFYVNVLDKPTPGSSAGLDQNKIEDFINTYEKGWPSADSVTKNEIILDAEYYYMLNVSTLAKTIDNNLDINKDFKTYSDISEFLTNRLTRFVKTSSTEIYKNVQADKKSAKNKKNINYKLKSYTNKVLQNMINKGNTNADEIYQVIISNLEYDDQLELWYYSDDSEIEEYKQVIKNYIQKQLRQQ